MPVLYVATAAGLPGDQASEKSAEATHHVVHRESDAFEELHVAVARHRHAAGDCRRSLSCSGR
jgi:hypothetical protein